MDRTATDHRKRLRLACLLPLAVSVLFAQRKIDSPNVSSRMDTIQSLVEQHSFCIDQSLNRFMVDVARIDGRFYSDKPPLLSVLAAGVYWPLHRILGLSFEKHAPWLYHILTVLFVGVPLAIGLWLLAKCLALAGLDHEAVTTAVFLTGAGTMFLPYAVTFNNHGIAATMIVAGLYCVLRAGADEARAVRWQAAAGCFAALAFNFDLAPGGSTLLGLAGLAFWRGRRLRDLMAFGAGAAGPVLLYLFLNWLVTGGLKPAYLHPEYYEYEGSILRSYDGMKRPYATTVPSQFFHYLVGYRGFFSYSPILLFGLWEAVRQIGRGGRYRPHAVVALVVLLFTAGAYAVQLARMAGGSYAMRWLLPVTPLFAFFMGLAFVRLVGRRGRGLFWTAAAFSILVAAVGVPRPWSSNIRSPITFLDNLAYFGEGLFPPAKAPVYWIVEATSLEKDYAYFEIGRRHMNRGYLDAAIADLEHARTLIDPERARALEPGGRRPEYFNLTDYYLGMCYGRTGRPDLAVEAFERLLKREPDNTGALNNYAVSLRQMGLRAQAVAALRKSLAIEPNKVFTLRTLGQVYVELKRPDLAVAHWEHALEIQPREIDLRRALINVFYETGNREKALEHLRVLEGFRPEDKDVRQAIRKLEAEDSPTTAGASDRDSISPQGPDGP